jgi:hypothetical protein
MFENLINRNLSPQSKVWFYFITRPLTLEEIDDFNQQKGDFLSQWNTHGKPNQADIQILDGKILMIVADNDGGVSGCSIDKSVAWVKELSSKWQMDLLDRNWVVYQEGVDRNVLCPLNLFWAKRKANEIKDDTLIWDTTVLTLSTFNTSFIIPFHQSWHARMW